MAVPLDLASTANARRRRVNVTVDRSSPFRQNQLRPGAFFIQHMLEYGSVDPAGIARAAAFMNQVCDRGYVAHHLTGYTFRVQEVEPTKGNFQWQTSGSSRGLFDPATGNQAAFPAMARVDQAKRCLVAFGTPKYQVPSKAGQANYDWFPVDPGHYDEHGQTIVRVIQESVSRGTPIHAVSVRQELKGQPNRNFGAGGGGQSEVDIYNAIYDAVKSYDPQVQVLGPHLALGGTREIAKRQRPLQWDWDHDYFDGWLQRAIGWDQIMLDWATVDMNADRADEGLRNPDLIATWIGNWKLILDDAYEMMSPYIGANKKNQVGFVEYYPTYVNLSKWNDFTENQKAAFEVGTLFQMILGGCYDAFKWQPEGGWDPANGGFNDTFAWFRKTAHNENRNDPLSGSPFATGNAVKWVHDAIPLGADVYPVTTDDPRVYGVATDTATLLVNLNSARISAQVEGQAIPMDPYTYTQVASSTPPTTKVPLSDQSIADLRWLAQNKSAQVRARARKILDQIAVSYS